MFDLRSRAGIGGVATGTALLALPVVAAGQVPVVDQVVGGVTQTAQSLAPAPVPPVTLPAPPAKPDPPVPVPAVPAPASPSPAGPPAAAPAPVTSARAAAAPTISASDRTPPSPAPKAKGSGKQRGGATAGAASGGAASDAQSDSAVGQGTASDVQIAAAGPGNEGGPSALPFTGLQLVLIGMAGVAALAGGALLRRAA